MLSPLKWSLQVCGEPICLAASCTPVPRIEMAHCGSPQKCVWVDRRTMETRFGLIQEWGASTAWSSSSLLQSLNGKPGPRGTVFWHITWSPLWTRSRDDGSFHVGPSNTQCPTFLSSRLIKPHSSRASSFGLDFRVLASIISPVWEHSFYLPTQSIVSPPMPCWIHPTLEGKLAQAR